MCKPSINIMYMYMYTSDIYKQSACIHVHIGQVYSPNNKRFLQSCFSRLRLYMPIQNGTIQEERKGPIIV